MGNRWYDPSIGRFLSPDPAGAGDNPYAYCNNNPVSNLDPLGLQATDGSGGGGISDAVGVGIAAVGALVYNYADKIGSAIHSLFGGGGHHESSPSKPALGLSDSGISSTGWGNGLGVFNDWLFGGGASNRYYGASSLQANQMHWSQTGNQIYLAIAKNGFQNSSGDVNTFDGFVNTARDGFKNGTEAQFGGVGWSFSHVAGASYGTVTIYNDVTVDSFLYHIPGVLGKLLGGGWNTPTPRDPGYMTPVGDITQTVQYTIPIPAGH